MPNLKSDMLLEAREVLDYHDDDVVTNTRMRFGYPRVDTIGTTASDFTLTKQIIESLPSDGRPRFGNRNEALPPESSDKLADVKRALAFKPATGVSFVSGARFDVYLKNNFETRVADGAAIMQVVDFDAGIDADGKKVPGLTYLRLGKPEQVLKDTENNALSREADLLKDQKYEPGIGLFSDGALNVWTRQPINLRSSKAVNIVADEKSEEIIGENYSATYEYMSEDDEKRIKKGEVKPQEVERKIVGVEMKRKGAAGWYHQDFKRSQTLDFSVANKGDISLSAAFGMSMGAKIDHSIALGFETSFSGKVELSKSFGIELGEHGAVFKSTAGSWTQSKDHTVSANNSITLKVNDLGSLPFQTAATAYKMASAVAIAAQTTALTFYNLKLTTSSGKPLSARSEADKDKTAEELDDANGLKATLDSGMKLYEAMVLLSAITGAAGATLAALQAAYLRAPIVDPMAPSIVVDRTKIVLRCGGNGIEIGPTGVRIAVVGTVEIGGPTVNINSPAINNNPVPAIPIPPPLPV